MSFGTVRGKRVGVAIITAKSNNGKTDTCKVYVKNFVQKVNISPSYKEVYLNISKSFNLTASPYPNNSYNTTTIKWSSSNTKVATVDKYR